MTHPSRLEMLALKALILDRLLLEVVAKNTQNSMEIYQFRAQWVASMPKGKISMEKWSRDLWGWVAQNLKSIMIPIT